MLPRVRILLPVWGAQYINYFLETGLRTLLAPRNLPAMAERCYTEFVFLTPERDRDTLIGHPRFKQLETVCAVTIVPIDDLLIDNSLYGYILTYAYHRGIISAGDHLVNTHFIFIVGDYCFSENSFDSLSRKIVEGHRVILSGSLRVDAEVAGAYMRGLAKPDDALVVPARDMIEIAIREIHPSLAAKIVNAPRGSKYSTNYQHLYWKVDDHTLISRKFMAHMLCIQPEFCPLSPRGFCDYTFIPDMAPKNAPFAWLDDSDDFFAMELQDRDHEAGFSYPGERVPHDVANSLSTWTTAQHRTFADHTFIYHSRDIPANVKAVERQADDYIKGLKALLAEPPKSHLSHPHWEPVCEMIVERARERWHRRRALDSNAEGAGALKFNFAMQVWGPRYIDVMLNVGLPSQLSTGNFQSFPWLDTSVYEIYTTRPDAQRLRSSPVFRWLQVLMDVKIIYIDDDLTPGKWTNVRFCHREAVKSADARGAALFFLCPDQVWPDGSITNAARLIEEGYTAVMCPGPRAIEEDMVPLLRRRYLSDDGTSLTVPARELIKAGIEHFHPEMVEWMWDAPRYFGYPSYAMFEVPGQGLLAHCYILHPVVINAEVRHAPFLHVFDQDYLMNACPDLSKIYIAQDSDIVFHFELSPRDVPLPPPARSNRADPETELMWYGEKQFNSHHRVFSKRPIRIHYEKLDVERWRSLEERTHQIIERIDRGWDIPDWLLAYRHPDHLLRRLETRYRHTSGKMTDEDQKAWERAKEVTARRPPLQDHPSWKRSSKAQAETAVPFRNLNSQFVQDPTHLVSSQNLWRIDSAPSGALPSIMVDGPHKDEQVGAIFGTCGSGSIYFNTGKVRTQFQIFNAGSASNHLAVCGSQASMPPTLWPIGPVEDLGLMLSSKGQGVVYIGGSTPSNASVQVATVHEAANQVLIEPARIGAAPSIGVVGAEISHDINLKIRAARSGVVEFGNRIARTTADALEALGKDRASALRLHHDLNCITSGKSSAGVALPKARVGLDIMILNQTDGDIRIYAEGPDEIDAMTGMTGIKLRKGGCLRCICIAPHDWVSLDIGSIQTENKRRSWDDRFAELASSFDEDYYLEHNPDVVDAGLDAEEHYNQYGWQEGRDPSAYFSVKGYLSENADVALAAIDPLRHFQQYGLGEKRGGWKKFTDE